MARSGSRRMGILRRLCIARLIHSESARKRKRAAPAGAAPSSFSQAPRCLGARLRMRLSAHCGAARSEEHTSELQSLMRISYAVFCLKKKKRSHKMIRRHTEQKKDKIYT